MKKSIKASLLALALLISVGISAQEKLQFGVKVGANISSFTGGNITSDYKIGFQAGVTLDYNFAEYMSIQSGLMFVTKGAKNDYAYLSGEDVGGNQLGGTFKQTSNSMYLQVPIHFAYKLPLGQTTKLVLHAGPYAAYGIGGKVKHEKDPQFDFNYFNDYTRKFDMGVGGGVGMEFGKFGVDLNCDYGLTKLYKKLSSGQTPKGHNLSASLSVGYKF